MRNEPKIKLSEKEQREIGMFVAKQIYEKCDKKLSKTDEEEIERQIDAYIHGKNH